MIELTIGSSSAHVHRFTPECAARSGRRDIMRAILSTLDVSGAPVASFAWNGGVVVYVGA
jgi:hypothetical protein